MGMLSSGRLGSLSLVAVIAYAGTVRASGVEDNVTGSVAVGRTANYVRANDALAVWQNPANLAVVPGKDIVTELRLGVFHGCFSRAQDPNLNYLPTEVPFEKVCNDGGPQFAGTIGFAMQLPRGFGFGVGLFTPGGGRQTKYGHAQINSLFVSPQETAQPTQGVRESPNRYLLVERDTPVAFLMAGVGYQPFRYLRVGASFGAGVFPIMFTNVTSVLGGTFLDQEIVSDVSVVDTFVPRVTASAVVSPLKSLDLMASFTWNDDVEGKGRLDVTANGYDAARRQDCRSANPGPQCRIDDVRLNIPFQRFEVVVGARYAQRRVPHRERGLNPMRDEIWDVEVDAYWTQTSHVKDYVLNIHDGSAPAPRVALSSTPSATVAAVNQQVAIHHGWKDTFGVRVGGDYNIIRELMSLRAGFGYESAGVEKKNMNLDYWPVSRYTISVGSTSQFGPLKLTFGYAHVFQQDVNVALGQGNLREITAMNPEAANTVNEGRYKSRIDMFSFGANYTF